MLDGDDLFALDMVEKAYKTVVETDADLVMWDYCAFYKDEDLPRLLRKSSDLIGFDTTNKIALLKRPAFIWVKLIRMQVLRDLSVHFPEGYTKQDIPVWWHLVTTLNKIAVLPERLSYYRQNPFNTSSRKDKSVYSLAYVWILREKTCAEMDYMIHTRTFIFISVYRFFRVCMTT